MKRLIMKRHRSIPVLVVAALSLATLASCASDSSSSTTDVSAAPESTSSEAFPTEAIPSEVIPTESTVPGAATSPARLAAIEVSSAGLGEIKLGTDADAALAELTAWLGPPSNDTGWEDQQAPCENMGSKSRYVEWFGVDAFFAKGPTVLVKNDSEHFAAYTVWQESPNASRFLLSDRQSPFGRTINELKAWNPDVERFDSEIEGPVWSVGQGDQQLSGSLDESGKSSSVRAGLFCID